MRLNREMKFNELRLILLFLLLHASVRVSFFVHTISLYLGWFEVFAPSIPCCGLNANFNWLWCYLYLYMLETFQKFAYVWASRTLKVMRVQDASCEHSEREKKQHTTAKNFHTLIPSTFSIVRWKSNMCFIFGWAYEYV